MLIIKYDDFIFYFLKNHNLKIIIKYPINFGQKELTIEDF